MTPAPMRGAGARTRLAILALAILLIPAIAHAGSQSAAKPAHPADIAEGKRLFNSQCAHCHGEDAGAEDPYYNLPQLMIDKDDAFFSSTVKKGLPDKGMPPWGNILKPRDVANLLAYIRSLERDQGLFDNAPPP